MGEGEVAGARGGVGELGDTIRPSTNVLYRTFRQLGVS